jgi:hypothetical protein
MMANKKDNYKKIRTDIINGKKRCIYMKPKGKREYVKSKGEFVLLSVYIKKMQKKMKIKGGVLSCFGCTKKTSSPVTATADIGIFDITQAAQVDDGEIQPVPNNTSYKDEEDGAWVSMISKRNNKRYYYNPITNETRWTLPPGLNVHVPSNSRPERTVLTTFVDINTGKELTGNYREIKPYNGNVRKKIDIFENKLNKSKM